MTSILHSKEQGLRVHKLANLGGLVAIAGLEDTESGILLGALLEIASRLPQLSAERLEGLRELGLQALSARKVAKQRYQQGKQSHSAVKLSVDNAACESTVTLKLSEVKALLQKLNGNVPVMPKDWIAELLLIARG